MVLVIQLFFIQDIQNKKKRHSHQMNFNNTGTNYIMRTNPTTYEKQLPKKHFHSMHYINIILCNNVIFHNSASRSYMAD